MKLNKSLIIFLCLISIVFSFSRPQLKLKRKLKSVNDLKLVGLVTFFRHSARYPSKYMDENFKWLENQPKTKELLTNDGIVRAVTKGRHYYENYKILLDDFKNIKVKNSQYERCKTTLAGRLKGMKDAKSSIDSDFSENAISKIRNGDDSLLNQLNVFSRVDIINEKFENDYYFMLYRNEKCLPYYKENTLKNQKLWEYDNELCNEEKIKGMDKLIEECKKNKNDGKSLANSINIQVIADYFKNSEETHSNEEIIKIKNYLIETNSYEKILYLITQEEKVQKLLVSGFYNEINEFFTGIEKKTIKEKVYLFSGHDLNLVAILQNLGVDLSNVKEDFPDFNTELNIELYQNSEGKYFVDIKYNNKRTNSNKSILERTLFKDEINDGLISVESFKNGLSGVSFNYEKLTKEICVIPEKKEKRKLKLK